jgi:hypothetical protein
MAWKSLLAFVCAGLVVVADRVDTVWAQTGENGDATVASALAVQTALKQGREQLLHNEYQAAVTTLESQLAYINGNQVYLKALQDAYRGRIKELRLAKQETEAQRYLRRLLILDKGAIADHDLTGNSGTKAAAQTGAEPASRAPIVRAKSAEERPERHLVPSRSEKGVREILTLAEEEYKERHFNKARLLYAQAHQADPGVTAAYREHWAYCKLHFVAEQIEQAERVRPVWSDLEKEVRQARDWAASLPRLDAYGEYLLGKIAQCRESMPSDAGRAESSVTVRHSETAREGVYLAETANFRVFHRQSREFAERAAQIAERTRTLVQQKWLGSVEEPWSLKCDIVLHATAADYGRETGKHGLPGHSTLRLENGRMVQRRIDVHCENPTLLEAVLPHETTHVALAGACGGQLPPRWADEGMAVLTEPREKVERHLDNLARCRRENQVFRLRTIIEMENYPENPQHIGAFYAQSVSLVEFLSNQKGPMDFILFLQEGMRYGYEKALQRRYGYSGYDELEQRWSQTAFRERAMDQGLADRSR